MPARKSQPRTPRKTRRSAGLLMFRRCGASLEVFLVHMGGPFWARKDAGAWSIPKGEYSDGEEPFSAAQREFHEETGFTPAGNFIPLDDVTQPGGKIVTAWAFESDADPAQIRSNTFSMEWPPKSGRMQEFPEVDRAAWFTLQDARSRILLGQLPFLDRLASRVS